MALLDLLLPPACAACGGFGHVLCPRCRASFRSASDPAHLYLVADPGLIVGTSFRFAAAAFVYEGALRRALQKLKYGGVARVAAPLADAAAPVLRGLLGQIGSATLVPVPIHPARRRERGYNQAELLARELGRRTRLPVADLLVRTRPTLKQHQLDRAGRMRNLASAFSVSQARIRPRPPPTVVIVDDIMTTSATLETCAAVLRAAGCERVYGVTIAREV